MNVSHECKVGSRRSRSVDSVGTGCARRKLRRLLMDVLNDDNSRGKSTRVWAPRVRKVKCVGENAPRIVFVHTHGDTVLTYCTCQFKTEWRAGVSSGQRRMRTVGSFPLVPTRPLLLVEKGITRCLRAVGACQVLSTGTTSKI